MNTDAAGDVVVNVEPYASWVIETSDGSRELERVFSILTKQGMIQFVPNIQPYKLRKLWLVNGPHLLAAVLAKAAREPRLDVFLRQPWNERNVRMIQQELAEAVLIETDIFSKQELARFNHRIMMRFQEYPDVPDRIMSRFRRDMLSAFFEDLDGKVGRPARIILAKKEGTPPEFTTRVLYLLLQMIAEEDYATLVESVGK